MEQVGGFTTLDDPFSVSASSTIPSCPEVSPGYTADATITVTVTDGSSCAGMYTVTLTPVNGSSPEGNNPPMVPSQNGNEGDFTFNNVGAGQYTVSVEETSGCNIDPAENPYTTTETVDDGEDSQSPDYELYDVLGNLIASTPDNVDLGDVILPEGECSRQDKFYVTAGFDNCDGSIDALDAVSVSSVTTPGSIDPSTQVSLTNGDSPGFYDIDVVWSAGETVITITMEDAAGNGTDMTITANVDDAVDAQIVATPVNAIIPVCASESTVIYGFSITDGCDNEIDESKVSLSHNGAGSVVITPSFADGDAGYFEYELVFTSDDDGAGADHLDISYEDDFGVVHTLSVEYTVTEASENQDPIVETPGNLNYHVPACEDDVYAVIAFQVIEDCETVVGSNLVFDDGGK